VPPVPTIAIGPGERLMTPAERRRSLGALAEEMEMMAFDRVAR